MHADRQPRGIVVTLYRGKVVEWWHDGEGVGTGRADERRAGRKP